MTSFGPLNGPRPGTPSKWELVDQFLRNTCYNFFSDEEKEFVDEKLDRTEAELKKISSGMCQVKMVVVIVVVAFNKTKILISFPLLDFNHKFQPLFEGFKFLIILSVNSKNSSSNPEVTPY